VYVYVYVCLRTHVCMCGFVRVLRVRACVRACVRVCDCPCAEFVRGFVRVLSSL
jgi:hypothetical protein